MLWQAADCLAVVFADGLGEIGPGDEVGSDLAGFVFGGAECPAGEEPLSTPAGVFHFGKQLDFLRRESG